MYSATTSAHVTCNVSGSVTFSAGHMGASNLTEPLELEVLKSILNREAYLVRLQSLSKTLCRKFRPELADMIDIIRTATVDVLENLVIWRQAKVRDFFCLKTLL